MRAMHIRQVKYLNDRLEVLHRFAWGTNEHEANRIGFITAMTYLEENGYFIPEQFVREYQKLKEI